MPLYRCVKPKSDRMQKPLSPFLVRLLPGLFFISVFFVGCGPELPTELETAYRQLPEEVDFNMHIRPLLSDRCYKCHGPDEASREAGLRLDEEAGAFAKLESGLRAFSPAKLSRSEAVKRILSDDPDYMMPPPDANLALNDQEKAALVKWVKQGARWKEHWSFIPPEAPKLPKISKSQWTQHNEIDYFIQKKLEQEQLFPATAARKERLLRRVSMDLTGLPPSLEEIDEFLADDSENAYEKVVDRLLNSPAYGERMAMEWMDVARYADSHGMHADGWRLMYPWRDWVIQAFNDNMPYDQFITWQLAGDLLPNASKEQKLATAFHRNHAMTAEGGVVDEEFRLEYVFDRTNTTATAFLGLTMECARCHDHKYDPISQDEYYQLSAFFNNVKELGMTGDDGNYGPMLLLPSPATEEKLTDIEQKMSAAQQQLEASGKEIAASIDFIQELNQLEAPMDYAGYYPFDQVLEKKKYDAKNKKTITQFWIDGNEKSTARSKTETAEGKVGKALVFTGDYDEGYLHDIGDIELNEAFSVGVWINNSEKEAGKTQVILGNAGDKNNFWRGWDFFLDTTNHLSARLIHSLPHNYLQRSSKEKIPLHAWTHLAFSYDGSGKAAGLKLYINGRQAEMKTDYDRLSKSIKTVNSGNHSPANRAIRVAKSYRAFTGEGGIFKGAIDEIKIYARALSALEIARLAGLKTVDKQVFKTHLLLKDERYQKKLAEVQRLVLEKASILDTVPEVMVMEEMPAARPAYVLNRGQYDAPVKAVDAGTPNRVLAFSNDLPPNRLGLAQWLTSSENPLTGRVAVNRYWQLFFGQGLVDTPQDFGSQGALPTHPQLLDWLAVRFRESGWDLKALHKLMVLSYAYRQTSMDNEKIRAVDPYNRLLARGPSHRLPAEMIRDNALSASGLLSPHIGGPSVKPYQPDGLWIELGNFSYKLLRYKQDSGNALYRRTLYNFIRRTSPPPALTIFDLPNRDVCKVKRENTNTPLQALVLLNDPTYVEAARVLAERMQKEGGDGLEERIDFAFRLLSGRRPNEEEIGVFKNLYEDEKAKFTADRKSASELLQVGETPLDKSLDPSETAALAMVASMMINHDETYMKR